LRSSKDLIPKFVALSQLREKIQSQYDIIKERSKFSDTNMFEIYFEISEKDAALKDLFDFLGDDIHDFFKCTRVNFLKPKEVPQLHYAPTSSFKFKGKYTNAEIELPIKIYRSDKHKCIRCFKYTADEENQICPYCKTYLPEDFDISKALKSM